VIKHGRRVAALLAPGESSGRPDLLNRRVRSGSQFAVSTIEIIVNAARTAVAGDAGMIASELRRDRSERHQMLTEERDAEAQCADEHVTGVVYRLFRCAALARSGEPADQSLASRVSRTGLVPRRRGACEFAFEAWKRVRQA